MINKCGVIRLPSGLFQGIIEDGALCFVVRDRPEESLQDAKELMEQYNDKQIR